MFRVNRFVRGYHQGWRRIRRQGVTALARPARKVDAHDAFGRVVLDEQMAGGVFDSRDLEWKRNFQEIGAALQTVEMLAPKKRLAVGDANRLEETVAVKKTAIVHRQG